MSAYTKRYRLGQLLSNLTRHFLLMTATPHNGKEEDFQQFMALLDSDRFERSYRDGVHTGEVSDLMRRVTKEEMVTFDNTPLLPERIAETVPYLLSDGERSLYNDVTKYVSEEFNRAASLQNNKRAGNVGFALTILQRRLASSPEAIYMSLRRRRERLENTLSELEALQRDDDVEGVLSREASATDDDNIKNLEDLPGYEADHIEEELLDRATAASTIVELKAEITTLRRLEALALEVRQSGSDKKWQELANLFANVPAPNEKLVIFTEHRDTLRYLEGRIAELLGQDGAIACIHGSMKREARARAQESFGLDPKVRVLLATDAAGEGINLQRAHLMVNYDLPWNPNRIEQRFGRIHRIGQTEVCRLWNLVARETREGAVYQRLLEKLEEARSTLGGKVFDVLGKVHFEGKPLRELLIEAIRYGERPEVRGRLTRVVDNALDRDYLRDLWEEKALIHDAMDTSRIHRVREQMERAETRRLQPHYIESFFLEAFRNLGGTVRKRGPRQYTVTKTPAAIRNRNRAILSSYECIVFEKALKTVQNRQLAEFVCPGHPLLDATVDLLLERNQNLLRQGTVLVDENDPGLKPRVLFYLDHAIQDATYTRSMTNRVVSKRMLYVELDAEDNSRHPLYAPYLDYRPLAEDEPDAEIILAKSECAGLTVDLEDKAKNYAITHVVPRHLKEVRGQRLDHINKTEAAVKERLTEGINYWSHRADELRIQEQAGSDDAGLNSGEARRRSSELQARMQKRIEELRLERQLSPMPPVILGCALVVPIGLLSDAAGGPALDDAGIVDRQEVAAKAREIVMEVERSLGFEPVDCETEKCGYDIESRVPGKGRLRFIEVKGRAAGANTLTVTRNEILHSLNKPEDFILAMVEFLPDGQHRVRYLREPFNGEPDFGVTSINYDFAHLLSRSEEPR